MYGGPDRRNNAAFPNSSTITTTTTTTLFVLIQDTMVINKIYINKNIEEH